MRRLPYAPRALAASTLAHRASTLAILLRKTLATLLRKTIAILLRQTLAILLRKILTSNPNGARACLRVQAQPARL